MWGNPHKPVPQGAIIKPKDNVMKKAFVSVAALVASASSALAVANPKPVPGTMVPEISALEGTAAIAALAAVVLLAWERRRRAS